VADVLVVDAKEAGRQPGTELQAFFGARPGHRLAWIRLSCAGVAGPPVRWSLYQRLYPECTPPEVRGSLARVACWRLGWPRAHLPARAMRLEEDVHASIRLEAHHGGHTGRFW